MSTLGNRKRSDTGKSLVGLVRSTWRLYYRDLGCSVCREWEGSSPDPSTQDFGINTDIPSILSEGTSWGMRPLTSSQEISSICF